MSFIVPTAIRRMTAAGVTAAVWIVIVSRSIPGRGGDRGIFVSVAERLIAGDSLYGSVWDNKDPLFFLTLAASRTMTPTLDVAIELAWLVAAGVAGYSIARHLLLTRLISVLAGGTAVPLILVGGEYIPGFTHLPGSSLTLVVVALTFRRRFASAGALLVVLALFKLILLPLAIAALLPIWWTSQRRPAGLRLVAGALLALIGAFALLAVRGELAGYVQQLAANFTYAGGSYMGSANPYLTHFEYTLTSSATVTLLATVAVLALTWKRCAARTQPTNLRVLWWSTLWAFTAALALIAMTGLRYHHAQVLYAPAGLALILMVAALPGLRQFTAASVIGLLASAGVIAGGLSPQTVVMGVQGARTQFLDLSRISEATQALTSLSPTPSSYARLGDNADDAHAMGLRSWTLACPRFAQYGTDTPEILRGVKDCLPSPEYLLVDDSFATVDNWVTGYAGIANFDTWNAWVAETEDLVQRYYDCEQLTWGRLCKRKH